MKRYTVIYKKGNPGIYIGTSLRESLVNAGYKLEHIDSLFLTMVSVDTEELQ
jgi:hypothetical protein